MVLVIVSCKGNNAIQKKDVSNASTLNKVDKKITPVKVNNSDKLVCDIVDFPNVCKNSELSVLFEFNEDPNSILINHKSVEATYNLKSFFEGQNYKPIYFNDNGLKILFIELIYEYNSHYLTFSIEDKSIFYLGKFIQEDLIDENNNYVDADLKINASGDNKLNVIVGDKNTFKSHVLDFKNKIEIESSSK